MASVRNRPSVGGSVVHASGEEGASVRRVIVMAVVALAAIAGLAGRGGADPSTGQLARNLPPAKFESAPCPKKPALGRARCGYLVVPENRFKAGGRTIRLAVAIIRAISPKPAPDPIVFLSGGPGSDSFADASLVTDARLNRDRNLIVISQRGTVNDNPALMCPEIARYYWTRVGLVYDAPSTGRLYVQAAADCRRRLAAAGIDLSAHDDEESAADLADLRKALRIPQWNVFAHSYGTELALVYMRDFPAGIRSVVLDGVSPPPVAAPGIFGWSAVREAFDNMVAACAAQARCRARYPNLGATFIRFVNQLEAHPVTTKVSVPGVRGRVKVVLDGGALVQWMILATHDPTKFPLAVDELAHGRPQRIAGLWALVSAHPDTNPFAYGMNLSIVCQDQVPFESALARVRAGQIAFPEFPASVQAQAPQEAFIGGGCRAWNVPPAPASAIAPTKSAIPTLLESGSFDAQTGAQWARYAARTLPNSIQTAYPGLAHGVFAKSRCADRVIVSFYDRPKAPNTRCVASVRPAQFTIGPPLR
jgi:pimeloyl-ACP methyl ester carboxylesterase